jgi:hypothetical protein
MISLELFTQLSSRLYLPTTFIAIVITSQQTDSLREKNRDLWSHTKYRARTTTQKCEYTAFHATKIGIYYIYK